MSDSDFKMPDLSGIMQAAQKLQGDVAKMQEELASTTCEASAGGGMVNATINGHYELVGIRIEPDAIDPEDPTMLQDLIVAAVNQAVVKMRQLAGEKMSQVTGGLNLPGGLNIPGIG